MRRENDPVSTTLDVGLMNNNQLERESQSPTGSEDTENENFWVTDGVGLSANYEWCCESGSSVDDPEESSSEYGLGWDEENRPNNWTSLNEVEKSSSGWQEKSENISSDSQSVCENSNSREQLFCGNNETINENEFNNNEFDVNNTTIAGDSVNQLDVCKNEEKIFYEKPKLNIQTVTYLYDSVLPPTVKCMNYVNSIKVTESLSETSSPEITSPEVSKTEKIDEDDVREDVEPLKSVIGVRPEIEETAVTAWTKLIGGEIDVDVEVVELTKSVKEIIQFPEIENLSESERYSEVNESPIFNEEDPVAIRRIDLIREAEKLTIDESVDFSAATRSTELSETKITEEPDTIVDSSINEAYYETYYEDQSTYAKIEEIDLLSSIGRDIGVDLEKYVQPVPDVVAMETVQQGTRSLVPSILKDAKLRQDTNKLLDHDTSDYSSADTRKKEKMARNQARRRQQSSTMGQTRRPDKRRADHIADSGSGGFDVYNIETAMPKIDLDVIESHLRAAREEERRRRNDREEIRRRLAMGPDAEDLRAERGRKPSLQSRLQSGMNLQICFMNETPSDTESPGSENDVSPGPVGSSSPLPKQLQQRQLHHYSHQLASRPQVLSLPPLRVETGSTSSSSTSSSSGPLDEADFFARQARLQTEARMALAQAKEMAHMQMEVERQRLKQSPITEMVRSSLEKVGVQLGEDRRRLSRVLLTELNVAQLQVVANDLHARIAMLNEALVEGLLRRDDLHMEQDSMLVDVEDLTRYLGAKQESLRKISSSIGKQQQQQQQNREYNMGNGSKSHREGRTITREKIISCLASRRAA